MNPTRKQFSRVILFVFVICLVCLAVIVSFKPRNGGEQDRGAIRPGTPSEYQPVRTLVESRQGATQLVETSGLIGAASSRIYLDPVTGRIGTPPSEGQKLSPPERANALSSSSEGLVQVPSPVPGGGVMVDLQGRFRNETVATIDTRSNLSIRRGPLGVRANETQPEK